MATGDMRRVLLHGGAEEWFDRAAEFAGRLAREFNAELHVVYVVPEPLSAGFTAEMPTARLPELLAGVEVVAIVGLGRLLGDEVVFIVSMGFRIF